MTIYKASDFNKMAKMLLSKKLSILTYFTTLSIFQTYLYFTLKGFAQTPQIVRIYLTRMMLKKYLGDCCVMCDCVFRAQWQVVQSYF